MRKSRLLVCIAMASLALCASAFATVNVVSPAGIAPPSFMQATASGAEPLAVLQPVATVEQSHAFMLESSPLLKVARMPASGAEGVAVMEQARAVKQSGTQADREAKGRCPGEKVII